MAEDRRLAEDDARSHNWKRWGPYLSERQWGTVREDYSADGDVWSYFPHDHARSRAYRWGEDGLLGLCDRECRLCFALALWNGHDPFLKERLFGLTNGEGNHGEDVKEVYFYLDSTPTHSWFEAMYRYPQQAFPYALLYQENARRGRLDREFELLDTGIFDAREFWDVRLTGAKASPDDLLLRVTVTNHGPRAARLHLLPTLWFRNTWTWGSTLDEGKWPKPSLRAEGGSVVADHATLGRFRWTIEGSPTLLFTENETNTARVFGQPNATPFVKDSFHDYVIAGDRSAVNPAQVGTKAAALFVLDVPAGASVAVRMRLTAGTAVPPDKSDNSSGTAVPAVYLPFGSGFDALMRTRQDEADAFYGAKLLGMPPASASVAREAYAGLEWSKQFYYYVVANWIDGDPGEPTPPAGHGRVRNREWRTLFNRDVILMPDKWEYPWYAAWDSAFHAVAIARIDPAFAKGQLLLFLREWYMHPNGQLPAYEWNFSDTNPPVHAWACWRVYKDGGRDDLRFLARCFHKLLIHFTWWVNRKDADDRNLFMGGFLGLDNISLFDRSKPLPCGGHLEQADATAWMAFFCTNMLTIALELARHDPSYEDVASKFFEHFVAIADAINDLDGGLWDDGDGFYFDRVHAPDRTMPVRVRSMVGLIPLLACAVLEEEHLRAFPGFAKRTRWFIEHRPDLMQVISPLESSATGVRLLALPSRDRLERILKRILDPAEFLSPYGIRSLSRAHATDPYAIECSGQVLRVDYEPGDSQSGLFGGNSNWRGPVWMPLNYLLVRALERYHRFFGDSFQIEFPTGSGNKMTLGAVAKELARRLTGLFLPDATGQRACHGDDPRWRDDPLWRDRVLFHEFFDGDTGRGLGASHQTGWTALIARLL